MFEDPSKVCIITDLDGTFLPASKIPLERDLAAVRAFESAGGLFTIATGRTIQASKRYPEMLGLKTPMIVFNGAGIYDYPMNLLLYQHPLPDTAKEMTRQILRDHPDVGVEVLCAEDTWVVNNTEEEQEHVRICQVSPRYGTIDEVEGTWLKVLFAMEPDKIPPFIEDIDRREFQGVDFCRSESRFYEMLPHGVSKGSGLNAFRMLPGMRHYTFVAVGDYNNDLEMLQAADFAVCPRNACDAVKAAADLVLTRTCEEGAMEELIQGILGKA